ncbi:MAG: 50S ribosomal protein L11 methyltransferase [Chromatiales bacterium]|jgi:tRNA1Val (adenine37-N6)-methyltransferase
MSTFRFQQFAVRQTDSAMKVCTDATLFGAMVPLCGGERVLDIGTGTGLLALMAMQLGAARATGVELTDQAYAEACCNFRQSPWSERLLAVHDSIQDYSRKSVERYDLIICNPPFFDNHTRASDPLRCQARHTDPLPHSELIACMDRLLTDQGRCYLLLPCPLVARFSRLALHHGLFLIGRTDFRGHAHSQAKVSALTFGRRAGPLRTDLMTIYRAERDYTESSARYLAPFLLRFGRISGACSCQNQCASA